jgi:hypothetical protein
MLHTCGMSLFGQRPQHTPVPASPPAKRTWLENEQDIYALAQQSLGWIADTPFWQFWHPEDAEMVALWPVRLVWVLWWTGPYPTSGLGVPPVARTTRYTAAKMADARSRPPSRRSSPDEADPRSRSPARRRAMGMSLNADRMETNGPFVPSASRVRRGPQLLSGAVARSDGCRAVAGARFDDPSAPADARLLLALAA